MKETLLLLYLAADSSCQYVYVKNTDDAFAMVEKLIKEGARDFSLFAGREM